MRYVFVLVLALVSACATQEAAVPIEGDVATVAAPAGGAVTADADDGLSTEAKVAIGLGTGALIGLLLYASIIAVGTSALLASG